MFQTLTRCLGLLGSILGLSLLAPSPAAAQAPLPGSSCALTASGTPSISGLIVNQTWTTPEPLLFDLLGTTTSGRWGARCLGVIPPSATCFATSTTGSPQLPIALLSSTAVVGTYHAPAQRYPRVLFSDDFGAYATGSFPSAGGWQQYWGNSLGTVIPQGSSNANSLRLVGAYCWSAVAYHAVAMSNRVRFEISVNIEAISQYGCGADMVNIGFWDPPPASTWGVAHDFIQFAPDGRIYVWGQGGPNLQAYSPSTWYHIAIVADFVGGTFNVEINGALYPGFLGSAQIPQGIAFYAGHGTSPNPVARFDDVRVLAR